jgi:TonB family protein
MKKTVVAPMLAFIAMMSPTAEADFYAAEAASQASDFARAFELFRELAELGHKSSQENLAVMYVNGEGVKRDNVLGYAWAAMAKEGGGGEAAAGIVTQLDPHLNAAARARVAELQARFGNAALQERLLPEPYDPNAVGTRLCRMRSVADPNAFFPIDLKRRGVSGSVVVEATVAPDGRARNIRALHSLPVGAFDEAGRRVALSNVYTPPVENGVKVACTIRFRVNFSVRGGGDGVAASAEQQQILADLRTKAKAGDPRSQLAYGLTLEMRTDLNVEKERPVDWFLKAAQAGIPSAQYLVGRHLLVAAEVGLEADDSKAVTWLRLAADAGQADAQTALANYLLRKNSADSVGKAQDLLEKAAARSHRDGRFYLAGLLATGPDAARRDPRRALALLEQVQGELDFDPTFFEVRAAAHAQLGDFQRAQSDQKKALQRARKLGWDEKDQQSRLASYSASKPWTGNLFAF